MMTAPSPAPHLFPAASTPPVRRIAATLLIVFCCGFCLPAASRAQNALPAGQRPFALRDIALLYTSPDVKKLLLPLLEGLEGTRSDLGRLPELLLAIRQLEEAAVREKDAPYSPLLRLPALLAQAVERHGKAASRRSLAPSIAYLENELERHPNAPALRRVLLLFLLSSLTNPEAGEELCGDRLAERVAANARLLEPVPPQTLQTVPLPKHIMPVYAPGPQSIAVGLQTRRAGMTVGEAFERVLDQMLLTGVEAVPFYELMLMCGAAAEDKANYFSGFEALYYLGKSADAPQWDKMRLPVAGGADWQSFLLRWYHVNSGHLEPDLAPAIAALMFRMGLPQDWAEQQDAPEAYLHAGNLIAAWANFAELQELRGKAVAEYLKMLRPGLLATARTKTCRLDRTALATALAFFTVHEERMQGTPGFWTAWAGLQAVYGLPRNAEEEAPGLLRKALLLDPAFPPALRLEEYIRAR